MKRKPTQRERVEAFKEGRAPYRAGIPPRAPTAAASLEADEHEIVKLAARQERAREEQLHLDQGAEVLLRVYGAPQGKPEVVRAVREAKRLARGGMSAQAALRGGAHVAGVSIADLVSCLLGMRGAGC